MIALSLSFLCFAIFSSETYRWMIQSICSMDAAAIELSYCSMESIPNDKPNFKESGFTFFLFLMPLKLKCYSGSLTFYAWCCVIGSIAHFGINHYKNHFILYRKVYAPEFGMGYYDTMTVVLHYDTRCLQLLYFIFYILHYFINYVINLLNKAKKMCDFAR